MLLKIRDQPVSAYLAEPCADGATEDSEDELIVVRRNEGVVAKGRKAKVVRDRPPGGRRRVTQLRRNVERNARPVNRAKVRLQADVRQRLRLSLLRFLDRGVRRPVRIGVEQPAMLVVKDHQRA